MAMPKRYRAATTISHLGGLAISRRLVKARKPHAPSNAIESVAGARKYVDPGNRPEPARKVAGTIARTMDSSSRHRTAIHATSRPRTAARIPPTRDPVQKPTHGGIDDIVARPKTSNQRRSDLPWTQPAMLARPSNMGREAALRADPKGASMRQDDSPTLPASSPR